MRPRSAGIFLVALAFLGACSRKADVKEPVIFFAPMAITNVPDIYKPLYLGNLSPNQVETFRLTLPYESISLERTPCNGSCPVYRVILYRSGRAEFEAKDFLPRIGKFTGTVDLLTYAHLCYVLDNGRFKDFKDDYRANWTEDSACIVTVSTGHAVKQVSDHGAVGPIELWAMEQLVDGVRESIPWQPVK
jgi:hypothetical protein